MLTEVNPYLARCEKLLVHLGRRAPRVASQLPKVTIVLLVELLCMKALAGKHLLQSIFVVSCCTHNDICGGVD